MNDIDSKLVEEASKLKLYGQRTLRTNHVIKLPYSGVDDIRDYVRDMSCAETEVDYDSDFDYFYFESAETKIKVLMNI